MTTTTSPAMLGYETPTRIPRPAAPISTYHDPTWITGLDATRSADRKRADTLNHVVENVLKLRQTTSPYAFSGLRLFIMQQSIEDIRDLMMFSMDDLKNAVVYRPKDVTGGAVFDPEDFYVAKDRTKDKEVGILTHELNLWNAFLSFLEIHRDGPTPRDPETINPDDFEAYRLSDDFKPHCDRFQNANGHWLRYTPVNLHAGLLGTPTPVVPTHTGPTHGGSGGTTLTLTEKWQRRKREADKYPELGTKTIFDQYRRELEAQMRIDDCSNIVNRAFDRTVLTPEQLNLDDAQQDFMYLVFLKMWKDSHPQAIIRQYETTRDARAAWR